MRVVWYSFFSLLQPGLRIAGWFVLFACASVQMAFSQEPAASPTATEEQINEEEYAKDATTDITVKNGDLSTIIRIFSKKTKRNYILDERVKGKVSIYLPGKVSAEESIGILDSVLNYKGFTSVPIGDNLWKIVPSKEARGSTIPTKTEDPSGRPSPVMVTRLIQLKYVSAEEVKQLISQLISPDGLLNGYAATNSLIIIDSEDNVQRLVHLVSLLDVPSSDREMTIIPVVHADAVDIAEKLNQILGEGSKDSSTGGGDGLDLVRARLRDAAMAATNRAAGQPGGQPAGQPGAATAAGAMAAMARQPKIIPDERTNAIIVVADEDTTARVRALISQLDSEMDLSGNRFYVYRCQFANAEDLAEVLSGLSGSGGLSSGRSTTSGRSEGGLDLISGSSTGSRSRDTQSGRTQNRLSQQRREPGRSRNEGASSGGVKSASLGDDISVTADPATNSLIIFAGKADYEKIKALLQKLDVKRRQVLVEAMLLEVGLDNSDRFNTSFLVSGGGADGGVIAGNNANNIISLLSDPSKIQDFSLAAASAGTLSIGDTITIPTQTILLNAARSNSNVNVLSAPTILTTDNEEAEIVVGQNVPFLASVATSDVNLNNTFNQIDRQDVGITLRLTPQISSGDVVNLKIFTEVSSVASTDPDLGPTTSIRTSETSVITKDSQMVVIGGLMADDINEAESGVPYLKDIPVLGHVFRSTVERHRRTNLLILITPRIIRDQFDHRDMTLKERDRVEQEIEQQEIYPKRNEILQNQDMDHVSEVNTFDGPMPSTILPPKEQAADGKNGRRSGSDEVLELHVRPRFAGPESDPAQDRQREPNEKIDAVWVVLKAKASTVQNIELPFKASGAEDLVGVSLPADSAAGARQFFQIGRPLRYQVADTSIELTPVAIFNQASEALQFYPDLSEDWYTLSPYEIMNLGQGPWLHGKG